MTHEMLVNLILIECQKYLLYLYKKYKNPNELTKIKMEIFEEFTCELSSYNSPKFKLNKFSVLFLKKETKKVIVSHSTGIFFLNKIKNLLTKYGFLNTPKSHKVSGNILGIFNRAKSKINVKRPMATKKYLSVGGDFSLENIGKP